jgi:O-antigen ligase
MHPTSSKGSGIERGREWLAAGILLALFVFSWKSVGMTRFNGLDSPLFLALSAFCLWRLARGPVMITLPPLRTYLLWAGWVLFSDFFSAQFAAAFARDSHWLLLPLFTLLCAGLLRDFPSMIPVLRVTAAASVIYIALHLAIAAPDVKNWTLEPVFGHVRHLSMAVGALVIWLYDDAQLGMLARVVVSAGRITGLVILFWAGGRGVLLALVVALLAHAFLLAPGKKRTALYVLEILLAALASELVNVGNSTLGLSNSVSRSVSVDTANALSSGRLALWSNTWQRFADGLELWSGWGGNGFMRMGLMRGFIFHPHNFILQILTDWGIIGLLLFVNFLGAAMRHLTGANIRTPDGALAIAILSFLVVTGMIDGGLYHLQFLIYAGLAFGMLHARTGDGDAVPLTLRLSPILLVLVMIVNHLITY